MADIRNPLLDLIATGYDLQFQEKGATHEGVLWASQEDQIKRFKTLLDPIQDSFSPDGITVNDLGCGYGAFFTYLQSRDDINLAHFYGYDIAATFIEAAQKTTNNKRATFHQNHQALFDADYSFVSGTFNLIGPQPEEDWILYVQSSLRELFRKSNKALTFNLLDENVAEKEDWLFYANPDMFYQFCKKAMSSSTTLHMNPDLKGFTICVIK